MGIVMSHNVHSAHQNDIIHNWKATRELTIFKLMVVQSAKRTPPLTTKSNPKEGLAPLSWHHLIQILALRLTFVNLLSKVMLWPLPHCQVHSWSILLYPYRLPRVQKDLSCSLFMRQPLNPTHKQFWIHDLIMSSSASYFSFQKNSLEWHVWPAWFFFVCPIVPLTEA